jgi:hypothetical protein
MPDNGNHRDRAEMRYRPTSNIQATDGRTVKERKKPVVPDIDDGVRW